MKEIKVGEYIRTKDGHIFKLKKINEDYLVEDKEYGGTGSFIEYMVKHSPNIIDLIEEGDYVNGFYCKRIPNFNNEICNFDLNTMEWTPLKNIDIWYDVVTKEQFSQIEYKVEE